MMILTKESIMHEIKAGRIKITPFSKKAVGPASIDLTLDNTLRTFSSDQVIHLTANIEYKTVTKPIKIKKGYILHPGELVLGITKETIQLPDDICGWLQSRSRFARVGMMSHISAPFICPGVKNHQVLEILNAGTRPINLIPGIRVCQLILERCEGKAHYNGRYKNQKL